MNTLIARLREERAALQASLEAITDKVAEEQRDALTEAEDKNFSELLDHIKKIDERLEQLSEVELRNAKAAELASKVDGASHKAPEVRIKNEARTYSEHGTNSFVADAYRAQFFGDMGAKDRLGRHMREVEVENRAGNTGNYTGLVVPQYLTDMYAELAKAGRPFANSVRRLPLPADGLTVNISRITTGSSVAAQATENSAVSSTDIDDTLLTVDVRTYAGQQDVSRQALERGTGVDFVIMQDLAASYAANLDSALISGAGTSGTHKGVLNASGVNAVTFTSASPTAAEFYKKLADAVQQVNSNRFQPATAIFMHPRRFGWLTAQADSQGRPLVLPNSQNPQNAMGVGEAAKYGQVVGTLLGLPVITDANIPTNLGAGTNEDRVIVAKADDLILWEQGDGSPRELRFEQTTGGSLTVKMVAYGYSAFTAERQAKGISVISGTGLVTPTF